jgi:predicted secreted protein
MATVAISSFGTLLKIGDGAVAESFTTIAEVKDIDGPNLKMDTVDVTSHSSGGGWEEVIGTVLRSGEVMFDINFLPTSATQGYGTGLLKDLVNRTVRHFQLVFPNAGNTTWSFSALVTAFTPNAAVVGELKASISLKVTGQPTLA